MSRVVRRGLTALVVAAALMLPTTVSAQDIAAEELPASGTPLESGRYVSSAVGPTIDFRVGDGWRVGPGATGPIFTLERSATPGTFLTVTRFDGEAYVDSCDPTSLTHVDPTVPRFIEIVALPPGLRRVVAHI